MPTNTESLARQLIRSTTSVGANFRAACRARSQAEFLAKLGIVEEEADETLYWIDLICEAGLIQDSRLAELHAKVEEVLRIVVSTIKTSRARSLVAKETRVMYEQEFDCQIEFDDPPKSALSTPSS